MFLWDLAVQRQAERIRSCDPLEDAQVDALMFVDALRNVLRGAESILGKNASAVHEFRKSVPHAVVVRDVLEHFDEYAAGRGKHRQSGTFQGDQRTLIHARTLAGAYTILIGNLQLDLHSEAAASSRLLTATRDEGL